MSKPVTLTLNVPHALGAAELRRRLDLHTAWAFEQFVKEQITIETDDWFGKRRAFSASGHGMRVGTAIQVGDDEMHVEVIVPGLVAKFSPVFEVIGRHYARRLLSEEGAGLKLRPARPRPPCRDRRAGAQRP
ncbi:hypothetical protein Q8W71_26160 [Methylobacterium sp. NEAU 140]|uniref:hypothetical protein n=1 Tax=Methylobacterium sp. NEAU 140 TaxID=3064945 RepID=UPI0027337079|nr:hypothetical protein [Methylobacterium sp. NEAU 140]MDP4026116.1 hypothetical protein [Methylobacterium sp. NEAU 140]